MLDIISSVLHVITSFYHLNNPDRRCYYCPCLMEVEIEAQKINKLVPGYTANECWGQDIRSESQH